MRSRRPIARASRRSPRSPIPARSRRCSSCSRRRPNPVAIVGGADWSPRAAHHFANFAFRYGIPVAAAFRRQDAICNTCGVYAGQLGYGPNPKLQQRIRDADLILAVGPRLGEATTDGYTLITPDHPGQTLVHVHPDPNELGRVYHADLPICADMGEFAEMVDEWSDPELVRFGAGEDAHKEWLEWSEPKPRKGVKLDLGPCVAAMREKLPENTIICNGAGNFSGWWHRYWRYGPMPTQLAPTSGTMGYGLPAAVAAAIRFRDRPVVCVAGDGDFLMNGQELATAAQYGADLLVILVDNGSYGTIRMHQEREYPERISATELNNPDFAALARAFGGWAETVEKTEEFAPALDQALKRKGIRLLHCKTDVEADQQRDHDRQAARESREVTAPDASAVQVEEVAPTSGDAEYCLSQYFRELVERFDAGFDPVRSLAPPWTASSRRAAHSWSCGSTASPSAAAGSSATRPTSLI